MDAVVVVAVEVVNLGVGKAGKAVASGRSGSVGHDEGDDRVLLKERMREVGKRGWDEEKKEEGIAVGSVSSPFANQAGQSTYEY